MSLAIFEEQRLKEKEEEMKKLRRFAPVVGATRGIPNRAGHLPIKFLGFRCENFRKISRFSESQFCWQISFFQLQREEKLGCGNFSVGHLLHTQEIHVFSCGVPHPVKGLTENFPWRLSTAAGRILEKLSTFKKRFLVTTARRCTIFVESPSFTFYIPWNFHIYRNPKNDAMIFEAGESTGFPGAHHLWYPFVQFFGVFHTSKLSCIWKILLMDKILHHLGWLKPYK